MGVGVVAKKMKDGSLCEVLTEEMLIWDCGRIQEWSGSWWMSLIQNLKDEWTVWRGEHIFSAESGTSANICVLRRPYGFGVGGLVERHTSASHLDECQEGPVWGQMGPPVHRST